MDPLTLFGLFAVTLMLVTYALEDRSPWWILAFAGACALASVYGFLQGDIRRSCGSAVANSHRTIGASASPAPFLLWAGMVVAINSRWTFVRHTP
jgi:hypothetical protein